MGATALALGIFTALGGALIILRPKPLEWASGEEQ